MCFPCLPIFLYFCKNRSALLENPADAPVHASQSLPSYEEQKEPCNRDRSVLRAWPRSPSTWHFPFHSRNRSFSGRLGYRNRVSTGPSTWTVARASYSCPDCMQTMPFGSARKQTSKYTFLWKINVDKFGSFSGYMVRIISKRSMA